ncbi:hypothetical protein ACIA8R_46115 [Nonomuraea sp. NPDC051191]|uniref:hypothetical protein n=1 Tax=Nonomuraea sp. NPDC051191 TaxID=3364372 RepID=UPI0037945CB7
MSIPQAASPGQDRRKNTSRKIVDLRDELAEADDSLVMWTQRYLDLAVRGVRSAEVEAKITRHLQRFADWLADGLGHDRLSAVTPREVAAWRDHLSDHGNTRHTASAGPMAPATVNNHLAHLSALFSWIIVHAPAALLRNGDPPRRSTCCACPLRRSARWPPPRSAPSRMFWTASKTSTS